MAVSSKLYNLGPNGEVGGRGTALLRPGQYKDSFTIYNVGQTTVYLNTDSQPTGPTDGAPLSAGSVVPWDSGQSLYAVCPTVGQIFVSDNSGVPFDAGAVAAQILDQGLAQDIANAISITGAPPIDNFTQIDNSGIINGNGYASPPIDARGYQSIAMAWNNGFPTRIVPGRVSLAWYSQAGLGASNLLGYDEWVVGTGTTSSFFTPVRGPFFQIVIDNATTDVGGGVLQTFGSYKSAASTLYKGQGLGSSTGNIDGSTDLGMQTWSGNIPASTTWLWQPGIVAGENHLTIRYTTSGTVTYLIRVPTNIFSLTTYAAASNMAVTAGETDVFDLFLPPVPLEISLANLSTTATLNFRATLVPIRPYIS